MIKSLRKKFIVVAMCSMFAVLAAIMGTVNLTNYFHIIEHADELTQMLAENQGRLEPHSFDKEKREVRKPKFEGFSPETPYETRFFTVTLDQDGTTLTTDTSSIAAVSESEAKKYAAQVEKEQKEQGFCGVYRYRTMTDGDETLLIFLDCRRELDNFKNLMITSVSVSVMGLLAVFILVVIFSKMVFRPVAESDKKQKQFITDASHEIKTPLTIIDANTEVLEMETGENQWTKSTRHQIKRLTALTNQLVTLARLDEGTQQMVHTAYSLSDAVSESVQPYEAPAKQQGKQLVLQIEEGITCTGDENSIRQTVGILLDNAMKYSVPEGTIRVTLERKGKKVHLTVWNEAFGLQKGNYEMLFERFYRLDSSRNSKTGGSGIGLSVAKALIQAQKGKIRAYSEDGQSLTVTIILES